MTFIWQLITALLLHPKAWDVPHYRMTRYLKQVHPPSGQDVRTIWRSSNQTHWIN